MKNIKYFALLFFVLSLRMASAQSYAYIDSDYILENVPEYAEAKERLDKMAERWTKEIEDRYATIKDLKSKYDREEVLLPKEEREKRKSEIQKLEQEAIDLQTQHFGSNGDYFQKRQELIKPIQDRVFTAMKKVAKREGYAFVFDKANQSNLLYAEKEFDISNEVLEEMGISK
jgi:outer membrane protein